MAALSSNVRRDHLPEWIGRFQPTRVLGRGGQGTVYLARDPELDRDVAIKTLHRRSGSNQDLLAEARKVARLQHPGIVALFDAGVHADEPFLVFEYVDGQSLKSRIADRGALAPEAAMNIVRSLLDALTHAHERGILHRDLSTGNVTLTSDGQARILDFGVAAMLTEGTVRAEIVGTVGYMAPEALEGGAVDARADVYAVAVLAYEMLTGRRLYDAPDAMAVMYQISRGEVRPPSLENPDVPKDLDALVLKGLMRRPQERYAAAAQFRAAIDAWFDRYDDDPGAVHGADTIAFLLRRMRRNPDFPAISKHIAEVNKRTSHRDLSDASELANVLLEDYALTTKVLKAVNAACYSQYGGNITTVSRAVVILGYEQVRMLALSIMVFDHLKDARQAQFLKEAACQGFMSALVAQDLAGALSNVREEEAFIQAMLHTLGRCLAIYYFPEDYAEIRRDVTQHGHTEIAAARRILGTTFFDLGAGVAREWNLPKTLIRAITPPPDTVLKHSNQTEERNLQLAWLANEVTSAASAEAPLETALPAILDRYGKALSVGKQQLEGSLERSSERLSTYAEVINIDLTATEAFRNIVAAGAEDGGGEGSGHAGAATEATGEFDVSQQTSQRIADESRAQADDAGCRVMLDCITELTSAMLDDFNVHSLLSVYLEAVYRGMAFQRVFLLLRDQRQNAMIARLGYGAGIDEMLPKFKFDVTKGPDLFNLAVRGKESVVLDTSDAAHRALVPDWCRAMAQPGALIVSPIVVNRRCIAMVYGDYRLPKPPITVEHVRLYRALTNQLRLAFQQKR